MTEQGKWGRETWSVFDELDALQKDFGRMLGAAGLAGRVSRPGGAFPPMNVWTSSDGIVLDVELPGVEAKDVDITVHGDEIAISGRVPVDEAPEAVAVYRRERWTGDFSRSLRLPFNAEADGVKATHRNGILRVSVPRPEAQKPKRIAIEAA